MSDFDSMGGSKFHHQCSTNESGKQIHVEHDLIPKRSQIVQSCIKLDNTVIQILKKNKLGFINIPLKNTFLK